MDDKRIYSWIARGLNFIMIFFVVVALIPRIISAMSGKPVSEGAVWLALFAFSVIVAFTHDTQLVCEKSFFFGFDVKENGKCVWRSPIKFIVGFIIDFVLIMRLFL